MKIAISTDNGMVSAHFGRCPEFTVVDIENSVVKGKKIIPNPGHHPGFLPKFLHDKGVDTIIAGGMGSTAQELFAEIGIKTIVGANGSISDIVTAFISGKLKSENTVCQPGAGKGYGIDKTVCDHE